LAIFFFTVNEEMSFESSFPMLKVIVN
jgi:hypothetical protein